MQLLPVHGTRVLRFSIADETGHVSSIEGVMQDVTHLESLYATFDPKTGEQKLSMSCVTIARAFTEVRPARNLPVGSKLQMITGLRGIANQIEIMGGLMVASGSAGSGCSYSGERLE